MMHRVGPRSVRGFTLLEAIVTLVIVSLLMAVLMQALGQSLRMRERLLRHQREARVASLQEHWFRDTVGSVINDLPDALGRMEGSAEALEFPSATPLGGGGLQRVRWSLQRVAGGHALHYSDATWSDAPVIAGPLRQARFAYLDHDGRWASQWQPAAEAKVVLPRMVRLEAETASGALLWLVPIVVDPAPPAFLRPEETASGL